MDKWESNHRKVLKWYERQIKEIYDSAVKEAAAIGVSVTDFRPDKVFSFSDYPITKKRADKLINELASDVQVSIVNGIDAEWTLANNKNNELCNVVFGDAAKKLSYTDSRRYYSSNNSALEAFKTRKVNGMNLSDRVWKYTDQFRTEIELGIDVGLRDGLSAAEMTKDLKQYLQYPDKLFRRVRDEHGQLVLSKSAEAFNPGAGVYRSSYKNALRLTRTENNMAYRTSDYVRWQQLDFVVGIEVVTSNNHPVADICDELAGKYPKDFKFVGWHPQCRCHVISILKTQEEMDADNRRIMAGEPVSTESVNSVKQPPKALDKWAKDNADRISRSKQLPYFMRDNEKYFAQTTITQKAASGVKEAQKLNEVITTKRQTALEIAAARHAARTPEQVEAIERAADARRYNNQINAISNLDVKTSINGSILNEMAEYEVAAGTMSHAERKAALDRIEKRMRISKASELRHGKRTAKEIRNIQDRVDVRRYGQEYVDNIHEMEKELGLKRGKRMSHKEADEGKVNPNYGPRGYNKNCSTCSATYYMRRLGFDVTAKPKTAKNQHVKDLSVGYTAWEKWKTGRTGYHSTREWMIANKIETIDADSYKRFIDEFTKKDGIYEFIVGYKGGGGHSTLLIREKGIIYRIEQQVKLVEKQSLDPLLASLERIPDPIRGIYRIDDAEFNRLYLDIFKKPSKKKK